MEKKTYPNRLGLKGWVGGGRWGAERYLFTLHRITGLGLVIYFLLHVVITSSRALGMEAWDASMGRVSGGIFYIGEFLVFLAFAFHALNGIRLVLVELGWLTGKAEEPTYPYKTSLNVGRPFTIIAMIVAVVIMILGGFDFFFFGH
ncbi:MAG: hypothetical protein R6W82_10320 [bacterium]